MPLLTRWFIRSSLVFFVIALLTGMALAFQPVLQLSGAIQAFAPVYFHLFLVGWVTQLIFGVVFWMFPKYSMQKPRGSESLGWATFGLLNLGLALRVIGEPLHALQPQLGLGWLLGLSALLQWLAGIIFVFNTWGRVKEK